jgi:LemA protein
VLILLILLAIPVVAAAAVIGICNGLVTARNACRNARRSARRSAFAPIDVQLQRRFDLIPNLIETAMGGMQHGRETPVAARAAAQSGLAAAKSNSGDPGAMAQLAAAQRRLNAGLGRLLAVVEACAAPRICSMSPHAAR